MENAAKYLKSVGYEKIGAWGISMGSVYVLLNACCYPDLISFVVASSPLYFVFQAINKKKYKCSIDLFKNFHLMFNLIQNKIYKAISNSKYI